MCVSDPGLAFQDVPWSGVPLAHGGGADLGPPSAGTLLAPRVGSWLTLALIVAAGLYLYGVWVLRRRGDRWPVGRILLFLGPGLGGIAAVTLTGFASYDDLLVSVHMVQHMVLSMVAPIFLAPNTLLKIVRAVYLRMRSRTAGRRQPTSRAAVRLPEN